MLQRQQQEQQRVNTDKHHRHGGHVVDEPGDHSSEHVRNGGSDGRNHICARQQSSTNLDSRHR
jgi:hypothetical protein